MIPILDKPLAFLSGVNDVVEQVGKYRGGIHRRQHGTCPPHQLRREAASPSASLVQAHVRATFTAGKRGISVAL